MRGWLAVVAGCGALLWIAGSSLGCAAIVGSDDYRVGGGAQGGSGGDGGTTTAAGGASGASGVDGGRGGTAGNGGASGASGSAGQGGTGGGAGVGGTSGGGAGANGSGVGGAAGGGGAAGSVGLGGAGSIAGGGGTGGGMVGGGGSLAIDASADAAVDAVVAGVADSSALPDRGGDVTADVAAPIDAGRDAARIDAAPDAPDAMTIPAGAGETVCSSTCAGAGLTCEHGDGTLGPSGLCTYSCVRGPDCAADHECIFIDNGVSFPSTCFKMCSNRICPTGMFCWVDSGDGVCTPPDWQVRGVGDDCTADEQCVTGFCMNKPSGFCSRLCQPADQCEHYDIGGGDFRTNHDEFNWCVQVSGDDWCVPSCGDSQLDCSFYPGTRCQQVTDVDGTSVAVCLP